MTPLHLDNATIRAAIARRGFTPPEPGRLHLFGVRLAVPHGADAIVPVAGRFNTYSSTLGFFGTAFALFLGSVDPGRHFTTSPTNPHGCAHLTDGAWLYQRGTHKGHAAFVQAAPVLVRRDRDRDGKAEVGEPLERGWFGIDLHVGAGSEVDSWSAGCQVVHDAAGWEGATWARFRDTIYADAGKAWRYYLLDYRDLLLSQSG